MGQLGEEKDRKRGGGGKEGRGKFITFSGQIMPLAAFHCGQERLFGGLGASSAAGPTKRVRGGGEEASSVVWVLDAAQEMGKGGGTVMRLGESDRGGKNEKGEARGKNDRSC